MSILGNVIWIIFGGLLISIYYYFVGLLLCLTIVGIPFGVQLFKIGNFALLPFGRDAVAKENNSGCLTIFMNVLWILLGGIELALTHIVMGLILSVTIIGIPLGLQHFKMSLLAIFPFGKEIVAK